MALRDLLVPEFDRESGTTRRLIERVPAGSLPWRPHARSMSLAELVGHLVDLPEWALATLTVESVDLPDDPAPARIDDRDAALRAFDDRVARARAALTGPSDAELLAPLTVRRAGQQVFTAPRVVVLRTFVLNHLIHHRGQLSVYLRFLDVAVPPIYGPSADDRTV